MEYNISHVPISASTENSRGVIASYVGDFKVALATQVSKEAYGDNAAWTSRVCGAHGTLEREKQPYPNSRQAMRASAKAIGMIVNEPLEWTYRSLAGGGVEYSGITGFVNVAYIQILGSNHVTVFFLGEIIFEHDWNTTSPESEAEKRAEIETMTKKTVEDTLHDLRKAAKSRHS